MPDKDEQPQAPTEPTEAEAEESQTPGYSHLWDDPAGVGDPIPFDPAIHKPPLSPEEVAEFLDEDEEDEEDEEE